MSEAARTDVARVDERPPALVAPTSMMEVIAQVIRDPSLDVEKLERLTGLYERLSAREAETAYNDAMNAAQEEMRPIAADANNPQTHSRYASYAALDRALRPIYTRHGFSISFDTGDGAPTDHVRVVAKIGHRAGHKETPHLDMPADGKGAKGGDVMTKTHAIGAAVTYGKRYLLGMIFNIAVGAVEEDGNSNGGRERSSVYERAVADVNMCEGYEALITWKREKLTPIQNMLSADEYADLAALWNRRTRAAKEARDNG